MGSFFAERADLCLCGVKLDKILSARFGNLLQGSSEFGGHKLQPLIFHMLSGHVRMICIVGFTSTFMCVAMNVSGRYHIIDMQDEEGW